VKLILAHVIKNLLASKFRYGIDKSHMNPLYTLLRSTTGVSLNRVYPKVSGLAAWSENCKCYSSPPLGAVVSLFCEST
jgi:hypothetical protein